MSYILEALKKAEQKREREEQPKLLTFSEQPVLVRRKRHIWPYLLLVLLFLNVGVIIWLIAPWKAEKTGATVKLPVVQQTATATPAVVVENREQNRTVDAKVVSQEKETEKAPAAKRVPAEPQTRTEKKITTVDKVFSLNELPPAIKSALPEFKVSGHAYSSEPHTRVVRVNEKILQEGQQLSPGLKVEEIVPGGIIFTYQGYRFRIGVVENR